MSFCNLFNCSAGFVGKSIFVAEVVRPSNIQSALKTQANALNSLSCICCFALRNKFPKFRLFGRPVKRKTALTLKWTVVRHRDASAAFARLLNDQCGNARQLVHLSKVVQNAQNIARTHRDHVLDGGIVGVECLGHCNEIFVCNDGLIFG